MIIEANFIEVLYMKYALLQVLTWQSNSQCVGCHLDTYLNMPFFWFVFLKHVPAQGEKEKRQGLAKKEKPKKDKIIPAAVLFSCSL